jgi:hypothetical protein
VAILITIITLVLVVAVIFVISAPLRATWATQSESVEENDRDGSGRDRPGEIELEDERIELETAREAKYREIRDTELDYRTGKLSQEDFAATDGALRAEAVEILNRLAALDERKPG